MKFMVYYTHKEFQRNVVKGFITGFDAEVIRREEFVEKNMADVVVVIGLMPDSQRIFNAARAAGKPAILIDKAYFRSMRENVRVSVNEFHSFRWLKSAEMDDYRLMKLHGFQHCRKKFGDSILFAGSSEKFCLWHGLGDPTEYARGVITELRKYTDRPVIYRPKPSWKHAVPLDLPGVSFSHGDKKPFVDDLSQSMAVITYGSNAALESLMLGTPVISLGPSVVQPLVPHKLSGIERLGMPSSNDLRDYMSNLAYCQWSIDELANGKAAPHLLQQIEAQNAVQ